MRKIKELSRDRRRLNFVILIGSCLFTLLLCRFFYIQVIHSQYYVRAGENQSTRRINLFPKRGQILDNRNVRLAINANIDSKILKKSLSPGQDFDMLAQAKRLYPLGTLAGQLLGFVGRDGYGLAGIEYEFDRDLFGEKGWALVRQDARQQRVFELDLPRKYPKDGFTLKLTLDVIIQEIVEECLKEGVVDVDAVSGSAIVMVPETGDILAMANYPFYDPNRLSDYAFPVWKNRSVSMIYEPGSTFKIISATAALEEGVFREQDSIKTGQGKFKIYDEFIHDTHAYGTLTFRKAIIVSSNVAFAKIGLAVGQRRLYKYVKNFGFGQKTGIHLPGEESGIFKSLEKWSGRTLVTISMGHEISVTLMQMAVAYSAVANGGILMAPRIVREMRKGDQVMDRFHPRPVRRVMSPRTAKRLTACLVQVVEHDEGTGVLARIPGLQIAGKTGTAEKVDPVTKKYQKDKFIASFAGFFPAERPGLLCMVLLDEPKRLHSGGKAAAPIFNRIVKRILHSQDLPYGTEILKKAEMAHQADHEMDVPDFTGMTLDSIFKTCYEKQLCLAIAGKGEQVTGQSIKPGRRVSYGTRIRIQMGDSLQPKRVRVPHVVGLPLREAVSRLHYRGISIKITGTGIVRDQQPRGGKWIKGKATCTIVAG